MKRTLLAIAVAALTTAASAQTLKVDTNNIHYLFRGSDTGAMQFSNGNSIKILGRNFVTSEITRITVTDDEVTDNIVTVSYSGNVASVTISGNVAQYVTASVDGAHVSITQSDAVADDTCGEITYSLSGTSTDGSFTLTGSYKASIDLTGVSLTSSRGAALDIQNGKRINLRVAEGTVNSLTDCAGGSQKGAIVCKGHLEFKQKGSLSVTGNTSHGIYAKEYITIKNSNITINSAVKDGVNCSQYFTMESGSLTITASGDDGIQCSYKDDTDREAEDTGTVTILKGTINIATTATAAKSIKADGDIVISGGSITATTSGGALWDSTKLKTKASSCLGADGSIIISGGSLDLRSSGGGGKGISCDGNLNVTDGSITIATTGGMAAYSGGSINQNYTGNADNLNSDYKSSPKGIKVDGDIVISGGTFDISTKGNGGEGIEAKSTLTIEGGNIKIRAYDDGTNSSSHTYIKGGDLEIISAKGDAVDSNGAIYVSGGTMRIFGAASPEQGFDAGDGYAIYITGGTMLAVGGGNSAPSSSTTGAQAYVILTQSVKASTTVSISLNGTEIAAFDVPADYTSSSSTGGFGGGRPGQGGTTSGNSSVLISVPGLVSGTTYTITSSTSSTTSAARLTGGSSGPGGR